MKVLIACEFSGVCREAFRALGHDAYSCDLLPTEIFGKHIQGNVLEILDRGWDLMIAHPPCTYLSVAGQVHFKTDPTRIEKQKLAAEFAKKLWEAPIKKIAIEQPVGHLPKYIGPYTQIIRANQFGHDAFKPTCLWLKWLPKLIGTKNVPVTVVRSPNGRTTSLWYAQRRSPTKRSITFQGIADAMASQWSGAQSDE